MIVYIHSHAGKLLQSFHAETIDLPRMGDAINSLFDENSTCNGKRTVAGRVEYVNLSYENGKLTEVNITIG